MKQKVIFVIIIIGLFFGNKLKAQKVGVVLSGGGASALAHVGVLKALDEAGIPIDYIVGASAGALIGALYSSGYSPQEIEDIVLSNRFNKLVSGKATKNDRFLLRYDKSSPSLFHLFFNIQKNSSILNSVPTQFMLPKDLDFLMLKMLGTTGADKHQDFDSLFVPFRCVASDVYNKKSIVFDQGSLNAAVRASMTYPFYINPIRVDGKLLYDGGLYNNFPADVLAKDFDVDYIIGSNVTVNSPPPKEGDVVSQLNNLLTRHSNFQLPIDSGIVIESKVDQIGTFDFSKAEEAIKAGYVAAKKSIDKIKKAVRRRISHKELKQKRKAFRNSIRPFHIAQIKVQSKDSSNVSFVRDNLINDTISDPLSFKRFKKRYFRSYSSPQIKYIFPRLKAISDSAYQLDLTVTPQKHFRFDVGGLLSSRPINTAYIGLSYYNLEKGAIELHGETYFGRFYRSTKVNLNYDLPTLFPIRLSPYFVLNSWDYYRSSTTFFQKTQPSFLVQNEMYYGLKAGIPTVYNGKLTLDFRQFRNTDQYYQNKNFSKTDTADYTYFNGETVRIGLEYNTLNRRQWATDGAMFKLDFRYVQGKEQSISGSTTQQEYDLRRAHRWINLTLEGRKYFSINPYFSIGAYLKAVMNSQSLFANYTATTLTMTTFSPIPDSKTLFMREYRAPQFIGGGINLIVKYKNLLELRISPYFFQPFRQIINYSDGNFGYSDLFEKGLPMIGGSLIFHTPFGPLRLSTQYYPKEKQHFVTQLSFGYVLFNDRSFR